MALCLHELRPGLRKPQEEKGKSAWGYRPINEVENAADWRMY
jgi:hypothetical protein